MTSQFDKEYIEIFHISGHISIMWGISFLNNKCTVLCLLGMHNIIVQYKLLANFTDFLKCIN